MKLSESLDQLKKLREKESLKHPERAKPQTDVVSISSSDKNKESQQ